MSVLIYVAMCVKSIIFPQRKAPELPLSWFIAQEHDKHLSYFSRRNFCDASGVQRYSYNGYVF